MTELMDGQMSLFDPDFAFMKTCPEHSPRTAVRTSEPSSKKQQKSQTPKFLYLDLRRENGLAQGALWETGTASLGEPSTLSILECPSVAVESHLSQILEAHPHPKYSLSATACKGILNRAERRGKQLPPMLKEALIRQSVSKSEQDVRGGAKGYSSNPTEQEHSQPLTISECYSIENHPNDSRCRIDPNGKVQSLSSRMGTGGNNTPMALMIGNGQADQTGLHDLAGALNCMHDQQAVMTYGLDRATYNQGRNAKYNISIEEEKIGAQTAKGLGAICQSVVRRLTPLECTRLQSYPDGWVDIGDWTDSKGKKHKDADSPKYKALGNSIAVCCWRFILRNINEYCTEHTMASLFSGIGGFELIWEELNGSKSCRWVSEIEEFPIAVTKIRFEQE